MEDIPSAGDNSEAGNSTVDRRSKVDVTAGDGYSGGGKIRGKKGK